MISKQLLVLFLPALLLVPVETFAQLEINQENLFATWVARESSEGILFEKADAFDAENYGMTFHEDGSLVRRSAKGMFEVVYYDHPGKWHFEGDTLVLLYIFDERQKAQEKVLITRLDEKYFQFQRLDWVEIRD